MDQTKTHGTGSLRVTLFTQELSLKIECLGLRNILPSISLQNAILEITIPQPLDPPTTPLPRARTMTTPKDTSESKIHENKRSSSASSFNNNPEGSNANEASFALLPS